MLRGAQPRAQLAVDRVHVSHDLVARRGATDAKEAPCPAGLACNEAAASKAEKAVARLPLHRFLTNYRVPDRWA